jgi:hypothetical protein
MVSLLLDENISPAIAVQIRQKRPDIRIISIHAWQGGLFKAKADGEILADASVQGLTLFTYDQKTIMPILVQLGYAGIEHAGVVFIDDLSIATCDFGSIIRSLTALWDAFHNEVWTNVITYLKPIP